MNFSMFREQKVLINISWALVIVHQMSGANLRALGVVSRYNRATVFAELDVSLYNKQEMSKDKCKKHEEGNK